MQRSFRQFVVAVNAISCWKRFNIIHTTFNSAANDLNLSVKNRLLVFNGQNIDSLNVFANTNSERLNYGVAVNAIRTPSMHIHHTSLNGFVANNQLDFNLNAKDQKIKLTMHLQDCSVK
jgi:hypothetical protein